MGFSLIGGASGALGEIDATHLALRASLRPLGGSLYSGSYRKAQRSGTIGAGLTSASLVYSWKWGPTPTTALALVRRIQVSFGDVAGFTAGFFAVDAFRATTFTTIEASGGTAGTFTGNNGKMRTAHATSLGATSYISTTAAISGGTSTLETDPFGTMSASVDATAGLAPSRAHDLFYAPPGALPMVMANLEGFSLKATAPATGTWNIAVTVEWDEVLTGGF